MAEGKESKHGNVKRRWVFQPVLGVLSERRIIIHVLKETIS